MAWHRWSPTSHGNDIPPPELTKQSSVSVPTWDAIVSGRVMLILQPVSSLHLPFSVSVCSLHLVAQELQKSCASPAKCLTAKPGATAGRSTFLAGPCVFRAASAKAPSENLPSEQQRTHKGKVSGWRGHKYIKPTCEPQSASLRARCLPKGYRCLFCFCKLPVVLQGFCQVQV